MTQMTKAAPGQIEDIKAHLSAGHQIAIVTYGRCLKLTKKQIDYIRADHDGYRLGWPGHKSVFTFAYDVHFVPAGFKI